MMIILEQNFLFYLAGETGSGYAQCFLIGCVSKNDSVVSERELVMPKKIKGWFPLDVT